ncbi:ead/Ea22-like family protein [Klebsiella variicola]|nr:ead/Ea22-like family protein [Klebsiella variicola]
MTDITELAQNLKAAAEKATPGQWERGDGKHGGELLVYCDDALGSAVCEATSEYNAIPKYQRIDNLDFIALANPANILALVEALKKSEKTSEARREAIDRAHNMFVRERDRANAAEEALEKAQKRIDELLPSSGNMLMPALKGLSRDHLLVTTQTAVDNYSVLHTKWLEDRQRIAELESRTVKLSPELYTIGELIRTQDNRITDQPMFVVFQKREIIGSDEHSPSRICWVWDGEEVSELRAKRLEALYQDGRDTRGYDRYAMQEVDEFVTACFTEHGCKDYLRQNGHNLRLPYIYACGSFRNNEYQLVRNWLAGIKVEAE